MKELVKNNHIQMESFMDSLISWVGGKKQLRNIIAEQIPSDIKGYIEPFGGAGWILFFNDKWADIEVYNDLDSRLTNLFKIAKFHPDALQKELELMLHSRELFEDILHQQGITDVQKAARFFYLIKRSFGSRAEHFGRSSKSNPVKSQKNIIKSVMEVADRLDRVTIENKDYKEIFEFYNEPNNFFFIDPPYRIGVQYRTGKMNYEEFLEELKKLSGRFLLTIDDCEKNRKLFKQFDITPISRINGINRKIIKNNLYKELIIKNY